MKKVIKSIFSFYLIYTLSGCAGYNDNPPLLFSTVNKFGLAASATAPDQGTDITVGYRSAKIAVVPVTYDSNGSTTLIAATLQGNERDAYSTFSHFQSNVGTTTSHCLGDTFATGLAAQRVADKLPSICQ